MMSPSSAALVILLCQWDAVAVVAEHADTVVISQKVELDDETANWPAYCVDVAGESSENGTPVQLWECTGNKGQEWIFNNGKLQSVVSSKCLDAGDMQVGSQLTIWDCDDVPQQQWGYDRLQFGTGKALYFHYTIYLAQSESDATSCLGVRGDHRFPENGAPIQVSQCTHGKDQLWDGFGSPVQPYEDVYSTIGVDGRNFCLDLAGQSTENGTPIQIWTCDESSIAGQRWFLTKCGQIQSAVDRTKCLNVDKPSKQLQLWDCSPDSDAWNTLSVSGPLGNNGGPGLFKRDNGRGPREGDCMHVQDTLYTDGTRVELAWCYWNPVNQHHEGGPYPFDQWALRDLSDDVIGASVGTPAVAV